MRNERAVLTRRAALTWSGRGVAGGALGAGLLTSMAAACAPNGGATGAGGGQLADAAPPKGTAKPGTKVTVVSSAAADVQAIVEGSLKQFMQEHPGVTAEYVSTTGQGHLD